MSLILLVAAAALPSSIAFDRCYEDQNQEKLDECVFAALELARKELTDATNQLELAYVKKNETKSIRSLRMSEYIFRSYKDSKCWKDDVELIEGRDEEHSRASCDIKEINKRATRFIEAHKGQ